MLFRISRITFFSSPEEFLSPGVSMTATGLPSTIPSLRSQTCVTLLSALLTANTCWLRMVFPVELFPTPLLPNSMMRHSSGTETAAGLTLLPDEEKETLFFRNSITQHAISKRFLEEHALSSSWISSRCSQVILKIQNN